MPLESKPESNVRHDISLSEAYLKLVPETQSAISRLTESVNQIAQLKINIPNSTIASIANIQRRVIESFAPAFNYSQALSESLKPVLESLSKMIENIDWDRLSRLPGKIDWDGIQAGAIKWGDYGWVISDLSLHEIKHAPNTLAEADRCYMQHLTEERLALLFNNVHANISRKVDFRECAALYEEGHYKACAMMLCSLIEGQLIKRLPKTNKWRTGQTALKKALELDNEIVDMLWLQNALSTYAYFYKHAGNFDRKIEGELNRNFLMHGMMYKPVRKRTCVKLFLLLESIVTSMPSLAVSR